MTIRGIPVSNPLRRPSGPYRFTSRCLATGGAIPRDHRPRRTQSVPLMNWLGGLPHVAASRARKDLPTRWGNGRRHTAKPRAARATTAVRGCTLRAGGYRIQPSASPWTSPAIRHLGPPTLSRHRFEPLRLPVAPGTPLTFSVAIISTGDEIIAPGEPIRPGAVYDSNAAILAAAVEEAGGIAMPVGIGPDDEVVLSRLVDEGLAGSDIVLLSGGTSKGAGDLCYRAVAASRTLALWCTVLP
jgi:hypothetical protein